MKIAIITGASSGIGAEFAKQIDNKCLGLDEIWLLARREERLLEVSRELHCKTRIFPMDLTEDDDYEILHDALTSEKPKVCILINAAGVGKTGYFEEIKEQSSMNMVDLNCSALTKMTHLIIPYMSKRSYLVLLASSASFLPQPSFAVYAATKSYVLSLGRALRAELKKKQISVTCVCPGPVDTEFFESANDAGSPVGIKKYFMADKSKVVNCALKDTFAKKELSIYGLPMKGMLIASKIFPHSFLVWFYAEVIQGMK